MHETVESSYLMKRKEESRTWTFTVSLLQGQAVNPLLKSSSITRPLLGQSDVYLMVSRGFRGMIISALERNLLS